MMQDNASFTLLHRIADVDRGKIHHLIKVFLGDVSLVAELLKPQRKDDLRKLMVYFADVSLVDIHSIKTKVLGIFMAAVKGFEPLHDTAMY